MPEERPLPAAELPPGAGRKLRCPQPCGPKSLGCHRCHHKSVYLTCSEEAWEDKLPQKQMTTRSPEACRELRRESTRVSLLPPSGPAPPKHSAVFPPPTGSPTISVPGRLFQKRGLGRVVWFAGKPFDLRPCGLISAGFWKKTNSACFASMILRPWHFQ